MNQVTSTVRIWDLPTRLCHVLLVICVVGLLVTGQLGGEAMALHFRLGYGVLTLVLFRLVWGVVGGHWSRFANFVPSQPVACLPHHATSSSTPLRYWPQPFRRFVSDCHAERFVTASFHRLHE